MHAQGVELLIVRPVPHVAAPMLDALACTAPEGSAVTSKYHGQHSVLVTYGAGALDRQAAIARQLANGGHVVCWDLSYWDRNERLRVAIGGTQPSAAHMLATPEHGRATPPLREDYDPNGHVLIIGIGKKTRAQYGLEGPQWELAALERVKARFPIERIRFRRKGSACRDEIGCALDQSKGIENALKGCALVVCRHSNVAIDACIAGIPVWCDDGAAHYLYSTTEKPTAIQRQGLLSRVAWWQWAPFEARESWDFILSRLSR